jgi:peptidyl-prolyl cis-trans isomerase C
MMTLPTLPGLAPARRIALLATLLLATASGAALGEDTAVARIGDATVTNQELDFATTDLASQFAQVPEEQRRAAVLNALIDIKLMAQEAQKAGVDKTPEFASRMVFLRDRALHNSWFQQEALDKITEDEVKARYTKEISALPENMEVHARHILVKTKEEAEAVIADLDAGKDFIAIAKEKTKDPSGAENGGDLGFFGKGQMVPEFEAAAFALKNGDYTKTPVQSAFGWHVIRREEDKVTPPPSYEDVKDQVRQIILREKYVALVEAARKQATIVILDPKLKEQIDAAEQRSR